MKIDKESLGRVLKQANNGWQVAPIISMKLRLAINSIKSQQPKFWELAEEDLLKLIEKENNKGVKKILEENHEDKVAFAIRDAKMVS